MKKVIVLTIMLLPLLFSCENQETDFADFEYTSGFFPYQYPVRTLILGTYYVADNSNDNARRFRISAAMGGVYENKEQRIFKFIVDESLCMNAFFDDGVRVRLLPTAYYQLSDPEKIVIDPGKFNGGIDVQLTDAFFDDPLAIKRSYVLPLRLTSVINLDTLLLGRALSNDADPRMDSQWTITPRHFTMFCVKFINPFHGHFLRRGAASANDGVTAENVVYRNSYIESDEVLMLTTTGKTQVEVNTFFKGSLVNGELNMTLYFESNNYNATEGVACTVKEREDAPYTVTGTGKYLVDADEFGGKKRDAIYLSYTVQAGTQRYQANDTLVLRDRAVDMELYTLSIKN
jgi:hypothetical protein